MIVEEKDRNGFSLIELIIAIAILIVLTGLSAPQFMKYIEKARKTKNIQRLEAIYNAFQVGYIEAVEESENRMTTSIMIRMGKPFGDENYVEIEEAICKSMTESLGKEFEKVSITTYGEGGSENEDRYNFGNILIFLSSTETYDFNNLMYYKIGGDNEYYIGTFGERKNGEAIKWR